MIVRRLRESFKGSVLNPFKKAMKAGSITPDIIADAVKVANDRLARGMRALQHVPGCDERWSAWFETCSVFVKWWTSRVSIARYSYD